MTPFLKRLALSIVVSSTVACASPGGSAEGTNRPARIDRNLLLTADVSEAQRDLTVMQVLQQLRPHFLVGTGAMTTGSSGVIVYQDGTRLGGPTVLNEIVMREIVEVRYLNASEAAGRFGLGHEGGAIAIKRRR